MNLGRIAMGVSPLLRWLFVCAMFAVIVWLTVYISLTQPRPSLLLKPGATLNTPDNTMTLEENDFYLEPGDFPSYEDLHRFLGRQEVWVEMGAHPNLNVNSAGTSQPLLLTSRLVTDLSHEFWIQILVAIGGILISGWIWSLKANEWGPGFFFLSGISMGLSALSSAVYSTRSWALPSNTHLVLQGINAAGAAGFGIFMVALFLVYPVRVRGWKVGAFAVAIFYTLWTSLAIAQITPRSVGLHVIIFSLMILIILAIAFQFRVTKRDSKSRAALTWLGLSVLVGSGGWVIANTIPLLWGAKPLDQSYSFISFLIIYIGLAAGLSQYRLFDVGQWAYRFLFYAAGALAIALLDAGLIYFGMGRLPALGVSLMLVGFLYLPLRDLLWRRFSIAKALTPHELLDHALHVAFAPHPALRSERWLALIEKIFNPLATEIAEKKIDQVTISPDGAILYLPSVAGAGSLKLQYPYGGRALFNSQLQATAKSLVSLIEEAESSREAYDRGVSEERMRIAQDLHDNVGARLLSGLHAPEGEDMRGTLREAISDIRTIVKGISGENLVLQEALADLRVETAQRLERANIQLDWSWQDARAEQKTVAYPFYKTVESCIKELISNIIKHSKAHRCEVKIEVKGNSVLISVADDGVGLVATEKSGFGLKSLHRRVQQLNGQIEFLQWTDRGTMVKIGLPLA